MARSFVRLYGGIPAASRFVALLCLCAVVLTGCYTDVEDTGSPTPAVIQAPPQPTQAPAGQPTQGGEQPEQPDGSGGGGGGGAASPTLISVASPAIRTPIPGVVTTPSVARPATTMTAAARTAVVPTVRAGPTTPAGVRTAVIPGTKTAATEITAPAVVTTVTTAESGASPSVEADVGTIFITKHENFENAIIPGACFELVADGTTVDAACDQGEGDLSADPGVIGLQAPAGIYVLHESAAPDGYEPAKDVEVTIVAGTPTAIDLINHLIGLPPSGTAATFGVFIANFVGADGTTPLGGVCVRLESDAATYDACDNADGDEDPTAGTIEIDEVLVGQYTLTATPPEGFVESAPTPAVTVAEGAMQPFTLQFQPSSGQTEVVTPSETDGVLLVTAQVDEGAAPITGLCVNVSGPVSFTVCDNGEGDEEPTEGVIERVAVPAGDYRATVEPIEGYELVSEIPGIRVASGEVATLSPTFRPAATTGAVQISVLDGSADGTPPLGGTCFDLVGANETRIICDDDENDRDELVAGDATPGTIVFADVPPGDYSARQTSWPEGYDQAADQQVSVTAGQTSPLTFANTSTPQVVGALQALLTDEAGNALPGACLSLSAANAESGAVIAEQCDGGEGEGDADGFITFGELASGTYVVAETTPPQGYVTADPVQGEVPAEGGTVQVAVVHRAALGSISIATTGPNGETVPNACFTFIAGDGTPQDRCDDDGDGVTIFDGVAPADYTIRLVSVPEAFSPGEVTEQPVTVTAGQQSSVTFQVAAAAPTTASLVILVTDENGTPLEGACFDLTGVQPTRACDNAENDADQNPGAIRLDNLPAGEYSVTQSQPIEGHSLPIDAQNAVLDPATSPFTLTFVNASVPAGVPINSSVMYSDDLGRLWLLRPGDTQPTRLDAEGIPFDASVAPVTSFDDVSVAFLVNNAQQPGANMIWFNVPNLVPGSVDFGGAGIPKRMAWVPGRNDLLLVAVLQPSGLTNVFFFNTTSFELLGPIFPAESEPASVDGIIPSPTTTLVALQTTRLDGNTDTWLIDTNDPAAPNLFSVAPNNGNDPDFFAGWSPSGDTLLVRSGAGLHIGAMGAAAVQLTAGPVYPGDTAAGTAPEWSGDGGFVAYFDNDPAAGGSLLIVRTDGSPLCEPIEGVQSGAWAPQGAQLWTLLNPPGGAQTLTVIGADCSQQQITAFDSPVDRLRWSPTGSGLAIVDYDDTGAKLTMLSGDSLVPIDMAKANLSFADILAWSPGGEMLAIYTGATMASIWVGLPGSDTPVSVEGSTVGDGASYVTNVWWL